MKTWLFICVGLVSANAFAGRESHGILPSGFVCEAPSGQEGASTVNLQVQDAMVVSGIYSVRGQPRVELPCVDALSTRRLSGRMQSTVFCARPKEDEVLLELQESESGSQILIWKMNPGKAARIITILPCR
ncbi:MAG: hypothetical protein ACXWQO_11045 [Bdellovibrionota bacterium]